MILVMKRHGNHPARLVTNVVDVLDDGETFMWKIGKHSNRWRKGIPADVMESRYEFAYALCGEDDCARLGVGDGLIKWLVWKNVWVGDLIESEMQRHIKRNPA